MHLCKYCHRLIWPWQSFFVKPKTEQEVYTILINPEYDRWMHEGCHFNFL